MKREIPEKEFQKALITLLAQNVARQDLLIDLFLILSKKNPTETEEMRDEIKKNLETKVESVYDYLWEHFGHLDDDLKDELLH